MFLRRLLLSLVLKGSGDICPFKPILCVSNTLVRPHLDYCSVFSENSNETLIKLLSPEEGVVSECHRTAGSESGTFSVNSKFWLLYPRSRLRRVYRANRALCVVSESAQPVRLWVLRLQKENRLYMQYLQRTKISIVWPFGHLVVWLVSALQV